LGGSEIDGNNGHYNNINNNGNNKYGNKNNNENAFENENENENENEKIIENEMKNDNIKNNNNNNTNNNTNNDNNRNIYPPPNLSTFINTSNLPHSPRTTSSPPRSLLCSPVKSNELLSNNLSIENNSINIDNNIALNSLENSIEFTVSKNGLFKPDMEEILEENFSIEKNTFLDKKSEIRNGNEISQNDENLNLLENFQLKSDIKIDNGNGHILHDNDSKAESENENKNENRNENVNGKKEDKENKESIENKGSKDEITLSTSPITVQRTLQKNSTEPFEFFLFIGLEVTVYLASKQGETKRKKAIIIGEKGSSIVTVEIVSKNTAKSGIF
jgi:hypothetical protein